MVIMIDDLDRCRPDAVLKVLEAVNYLASAGDCFVVLAMDRNRVRRYIGHAFEEYEAAVTDEALQAGAASESEAAAKPDLFARQYLEKLINLDIPVPKPTDEQRRKLVGAGESAQSQAGKPDAGKSAWEVWERRLARGGRFVRPCVAPLLLTGLVLVGFQYGTQWSSQPLDDSPPPAAVAGENARGAGASGFTDTQPSSPPDATSRPAADSRDVVELGETADTSGFAGMIVAIALLLAVGILRLADEVDIAVHDSDDFSGALAIWQDLVAHRRGTPRHLKRFVNRVRLLAMRERDLRARLPGWIRVYRWIRQRFTNWRPAKLNPGVFEQDEEMLVALSAIQDYDEPQLQDDDRWRVLKADEGGAEHGIKERLKAAVSGHRKKFAGWAPTDEQRNRVLALVKGLPVP